MNPEKHAVHGGDFFKAIGEEFDDLWRRREVVNADVLDAWYEPAPEVLAAVQEHLSWLMRTSPPTHGEGLVRVIAQARGVLENSVVVGAGSSSLIYLAFPILLHEPKPIVLLDPTYGEYEHLAKRLGLPVRKVFLEPENGFRPSVDGILEAAKGAGMVALVNPNSPTGVSMPKNEIQALLEGLDADTTLWVDETYIDFAPGDQSVEPLVAAHRYLVVAKSMSKFYALSGLRVGYLVCNEGLADRLRQLSPPWPVGLLSQVAAVRALQSPGYYRQKALETAALREALFRSLSKIREIRPFPSEANFILCRLEGLTASEVCARAETSGVFLRNCDSLSERFQDRFVRTAVKGEEENARILEALSQAR
ncbi:MAG: histidinol-phosphate aminotransferase family protein [Armatimonadetes bacterium]|nr:histidinol-phosphate aminotransferase family protein [Armatimonadota bacterium]